MVRFGSLVFGLFVFALGIVFILESKLGLSPWDVLNQGLAKHTPLSFGMANVAVGVVVLLLAWALGGAPWLGTVMNAVLVGVFVDALLAIGAVSHLHRHDLALRVAFLALGIASMGIGTAFYIGADYGAGPRDTLMLTGARRTGVRIGVVRACIEVTALAIGIALGGTFGVGTVAFAALIGPVVELSFRGLAATPLAARD